MVSRVLADDGNSTRQPCSGTQTFDASDSPLKKTSDGDAEEAV